MRTRSGSFLLIMILLVSSLETLTAARFAYVMEGDHSYHLEQIYLTRPVTDAQLISDMLTTDRFEAMIKRSQAVHEGYVSGSGIPQEEKTAVTESQRIDEETTWIDLSDTGSSLRSYTLREHIMVKEKLDALWIISLKKAGDLFIGKVTVYHRGEETGDLAVDELVDLSSQEEFTAWLLPVLYEALYDQKVATLKLNSFTHAVKISLDGTKLPPSPLYLIPYGIHQITLSAPFHHSETREVTVMDRTFQSIDADLEPVMLKGMLVTGQGTASVGDDLIRDLPFIVSERPLPVTLKVSCDGYMEEMLTFEKNTEAVDIRLKPLAFDPEVTIARVQRTFYSSLARTMLSFAASRIYGIVSEGSHPVVSNLLDGITIISAGDTVRLLFDYYAKSKYSVSTVLAD